jgi:Apea-like HEPN
MTPDQYSHNSLKTKQRAIRDQFHTNLGLRIHRSLSWLQRSEYAKGDHDSAFLFLWISFNAAYSQEIPKFNDYTERGIFIEFLDKILSLDSSGLIYGAIWQKFSGPIRLIMDNQFVYQAFWQHHNGVEGYEDWENRFQRSKSRFNEAIVKKDTLTVLSTLFDRLYVLRNQLVHGGATWNSKINRSQVKDGAEILATLMPIFLDLMMDHPEIDWPQPHYPVV